MARVNIEEEAWKRIYRLADLMGCSVREAAGTVACLWGQSQDLVKTHGTKNEIVEWASLFKISENESEKWISCLEKVHFISCKDASLWEIHGNKIQLQTRAANSKKASKGGQALRKKVRKLARLEAGLKPPTQQLEADPKTPFTLHYSALQSIAGQADAGLVPAAPPPPEEPAPSAAETFEKSFSPEVQKIREMTRDSFGNRLSHLATKIFLHWGSAEKFYTWLVDLETNYRKNPKDLSLVSWTEICVKKELGVIGDKRAE